MCKIIELDADIKYLPEFEEFIADTAAGAGFENSAIMKIQLAIEEIIVNIISYAYPDGEKGRIRLSCLEKSSDRLVFKIEDNGQPFNLLEAEMPDITQPLESRDVGGLGIFLTRQFMDEIEYKREKNKNILFLTKFK
jgi:anti-sigma regulatory factor (Ser/Thr protein kinase)